jgi:hypothetical protein
VSTVVRSWGDVRAEALASGRITEEGVAQAHRASLERQRLYDACLNDLAAAQEKIEAIGGDLLVSIQLDGQRLVPVL